MPFGKWQTKFQKVKTKSETLNMSFTMYCTATLLFSLFLYILQKININCLNHKQQNDIWFGANKTTSWLARNLMFYHCRYEHNSFALWNFVRIFRLELYFSWRESKNNNENKSKSILNRNIIRIREMWKYVLASQLRGLFWMSWYTYQNYLFLHQKYGIC